MKLSHDVIILETEDPTKKMQRVFSSKRRIKSASTAQEEEEEEEEEEVFEEQSFGEIAKLNKPEVCYIISEQNNNSVFFLIFSKTCLRWHYVSNQK